MIGRYLIDDGKLFRPSETDPLVPGKASRPRSRSLDLCIGITCTAILTMAIAFGLYALVFPLSSCNNPLDPDVRDRIRKEWDIERRQHQGEVLKRIDIEQRWRVEDDERVHLRVQWMREIEEHEHNLSEAIRRENQEKLARRAQWEREVEEHDRDIKERARREEEERLRLNMFWTDPESHTCTTYGTREYTARLVNVPGDYNRRVEACMATPIQVHGVEYKTKWCEDHVGVPLHLILYEPLTFCAQGPSNVIGHWDVDQHEPDCASYWNWYKDLVRGFIDVSPAYLQLIIYHRAVFPLDLVNG
jgi:hypothetical protein